MEDKLTSAIKCRRFLEREKDWLYSYIQKDKLDHFNELESKFTELVKGYIKKYYDPDLLMLGEKLYCNTKDSVYISSSALGLPDTYRPFKDGYSVEVSRWISIGIRLPYPIDEKARTKNNITSEFFKEKCTEPELDLLKETLLDLAKAKYDYSYFGYDNWMGCGYRGRFRGTDTWGNLYTRSPEYFRLVRDKFLSDEEKEEMNSELSLIQDMKRILGY